MSDYEIDEIRRIRHKISAEHGYDVKKLADYYRQLEEKFKESGKYKSEVASNSEQAQVEQTAI